MGMIKYKVHYSNLNPSLTREGTAHFTRNGKHQLLTSGMTGYVQNPSEVAIADDWQEQYRSNIGAKNHDKN